MVVRRLSLLQSLAPHQTRPSAHQTHPNPTWRTKIPLTPTHLRPAPNQDETASSRQSMHPNATEGTFTSSWRTLETITTKTLETIMPICTDDVFSKVTKMKVQTLLVNRINLTRTTLKMLTHAAATLAKAIRLLQKNLSFLKMPLPALKSRWTKRPAQGSTRLRPITSIHKSSKVLSQIKSSWSTKTS